MNRVVVGLLSMVFCALPLAAHADTFNFAASGSGKGFNGSGMFTTTAQGNGSYLITAISGSGNDGSMITGLIPVGGFEMNDNLLFPGASSLVDSGGFSFTDVLGNTAFMVNIFHTRTGSYAGILVDSDGNRERFPVTFNVANTVTPEPSSLLLLGTGVAAMAFLMRRRFTGAARLTA